jgi:YfiR/HmsC-like
MLTDAHYASAQSTDYKSYALYVYNFMKYIEWPQDKSNAQFVIALMGNSPIEKEFELLAKNKKITGRVISFIKCKTVEETKDADLIYVPSSQNSFVKQLATLKKNMPVLIVAEREGMVSRGAAISFFTLENDELRFEINKKELELHHLNPSTSLLKLGVLH